MDVAGAHSQSGNRALRARTSSPSREPGSRRRRARSGRTRSAPVEGTLPRSQIGAIGGLPGATQRSPPPWHLKPPNDKKVPPVSTAHRKQRAVDRARSIVVPGLVLSMYPSIGCLAAGVRQQGHGLGTVQRTAYPAQPLTPSPPKGLSWRCKCETKIMSKPPCRHC